MRGISLDRIHELLVYEPETGLLCWKVQRGRARVGSVAGCLDGQGYRTVTVDRVHAGSATHHFNEFARTS